MIIKSFIRNINTKIYIIIFTLLIIILAFLYYSYNESLNGSYIIISNYDNLLDNYIKKYEVVIYNNNKTYKLDHSLKNNQIALSYRYKSFNTYDVCYWLLYTYDV